MTLLAGLDIRTSATVSKYAKPALVSRSDKVAPRSWIDQRFVIAKKPRVKQPKPPKVPRPPRPPRPKKPPKRYHADPAARGKGTVIACVSMPKAELALLDALAKKTQTSRSHFIRQAVKHFGVKLFPDLDPHDPASVEKFCR